MKFTFKTYENLIHKIEEAGYTFTSYHTWKNAENPCILRHDIDMDLKRAAEFSDFEFQILGGGYHSTYFVLITSDLYNPFSKKNVSYLHRILNNGHEIGLHFDEKKYMDEDTFDKDYLKICVKKEVSLLSEILGKEVTCISMHRPSRSFLDANIAFDGLVNSYSKVFFQQFKYLSDSRMNWREDVEQVVAEKKKQALHILTHPIWYEKEEQTIREVMKRFICSAIPERFDVLADNVSNLKEIVSLEDIYGIGKGDS